MTPLELGVPTLLRLPSRLGDFVAAEPFAAALCAAFEGREAGDRVGLSAPEPLLSLLDGRFPGARRIPLARAGGDRAGPWRGYDQAVLLTGSFRSAWAALRAGIPRRVGWSRDLRGWLLSEGVRPPLERGGVPAGMGRPGRWPRVLPRPVAAACYELGLHLGLPMHRTRPRLTPTPAAAEALDARLALLGIDPEEPLLAANVGSRPGSAKAWPAGHWVRALDSLGLHLAGLPVVLVCGPGEEEVLAGILDAARSRTLFPLLEPACGLGELVALAARSRAFLTADSGPRHVAAAAGAPVVCVFGPTDPRHTAHDLDRTESLRIEVPCGPCHRERCPLVGHQHHACMQLVDPEKVLAATRRLLEGEDRPGVPPPPRPPLLPH